MRTMLLAAGCAAALATTPVVAEDHDDHMLSITQIQVKLGHNMKFRAGMKAYMECYAAAGGEGEWGTWSAMDGKGIEYHIVGEMDGWAELGEKDEAARSCWGTVEEEIAPHMASMNSIFAKRMPDWSPSEDPEDTTVVRLYNFLVDDGAQFRAAVGSITSVMKAAEYKYQGTWYDVQGGGLDDPDYFVVESFKDFAAMDEERAGPYKLLVEHAGEEAADIFWDEFGESLEDGVATWSMLLSYDDELSHSDD